MTSSPLASPSATLAVLKRHGLYTKKSFGQHFLVDDNVIGRIVDLAALAGDETVVEVGPGIGTLTLALCQVSGAVVAVERDAALAPVLAETTAVCARFGLVQADALTVTAEAISAPFGPPQALVANLPYQVAATVVLRYLELLPTLQQVTVMVQAEVADRMAAAPGGKDYGAYTVKLRLLAEPVERFRVGPGCFLPPPRVDSAVIRLNRRSDPLSEEVRAAAKRVAEAAFAQRRKTLRNSLKAVLAVPLERIDDALAASGLDGGARAETVPVEGFVRLGQLLRDVL